MLCFVDGMQALQYIFNTSGYQFSKPAENRASAVLTTGKGIGWAEGCFDCRWKRISSYRSSPQGCNMPATGKS